MFASARREFLPDLTEVGRTHPPHERPLPESRERQALRLMAWSLFALAAHVSFDSVRALLAARRNGTSADF